MANWLIQDNVFSEPFFDKIIELFDRFEINYQIIKAIPFTGEFETEIKFDVNQPLVSIGSYSFTNKIKTLYSPGSWTNENYDYRVWSTKWSNVLNIPAKIMKFGEVDENVPFFIRPCADDKLFTGQVIEDKESFKKWQQDVINIGCYTELNYASPVVIAEPCKIEDEYRFIVINGNVITGSLYGKNKGYKEVTKYENPELWKFVEDRIAEWQPSSVFCIDIAVSNGYYWVLEMGNFNSAGLYHCDIQKIVFAIEDFLC